MHAAWNCGSSAGTMGGRLAAGLALVLLALSGLTCCWGKDRQEQRARRFMSASGSIHGTTTTTSTTSGTAKASSNNLYDAADGRLAMMQKLIKRDMDSLSMVDMMVHSKAMDTVLARPRALRMLLDHMPLLGAFDGFKQLIDNPDATPEEMSKGFRKGLEAALEFAKDMPTKVQDPGLQMDTIIDMAKSGDPKVKALFERAKGGDGSAMADLKKLAQRQLFPGMDADVVEKVGRGLNFDSMLENETIMRWMDKDPHISKLIRNAALLKNEVPTTTDSATTSSSSNGVVR